MTENDGKFPEEGCLKVIETREYRQLGGGKFCISFLSDGTALPCHYDVSGRWSFLEPKDANDVFGLEGERVLGEETIFIHGQKRAVLQRKLEEWKTQVSEGS